MSLNWFTHATTSQAQLFRSRSQSQRTQFSGFPRLSDDSHLKQLCAFLPTQGSQTLSFYYLFIQHIKTTHNEVGLDGNVYNTQGQAVLTAVTDVNKRVCIVSSKWVAWNFCNYLFLWFLWGRIDNFGFVKGEYEKNFENHCSTFSQLTCTL